MFTTEIIIFILATLAGILLYWRESKNNYLFRLVNRITHSKEQQMKKTAKKGFLFMQPFLVRLVYIVLLVLVVYLISEFLTPVPILSIKFFATIIVGMTVGTYFASLIVFANKKVEGGQDLIEETLEKGKEMLKDFTEGDNDNDNDKTTLKKEVEKEETKEKKAPKKSARDRLKDKGFIN